MPHFPHANLLHLPAFRVGRVRRHQAFHRPGLHSDDTHGDATQACTAHHHRLAPALQVLLAAGTRWKPMMMWMDLLFAKVKFHWYPRSHTESHFSLIGLESAWTKLKGAAVYVHATTRRQISARLPKEWLLSSYEWDLLPVYYYLPLTQAPYAFKARWCFPSAK